MPDSDPAARPNPLRAANIFRAVCIALVFFYVIRLAGIASSFLLAAFLGILFGLNLSALADFLQRWRVPRAVSAAGVVLILFGVLAGGSVLLGPTLREQGRSIREQLPKAIGKVDQRLQSVGVVIPMAKMSAEDSIKADSVRTAQGADSAMTRERRNVSGDSISALQSQLQSRIGTLGHVAASMMSTAVSAVTGVFVVIFIAVFYAVEPDVYRNGLLHLIPRKRQQRVGQVMTATGNMLRQWLRAQFLAMLCIGALSTLAYYLIGLKAPIALGIVAGICEFVPFVGPVLAAIPAIAMALADSPDKAVYVIIASLVIQQSEEVLIVPLLMKKNLTLPPILTIVAQGAMGLAFGVLGLLVAVPLLAAVMVPVKMLYVEDVVGDDMQVDTGGS